LVPERQQGAPLPAGRTVRTGTTSERPSVADQTWLPRKLPPLVRATLADTYRSHLSRHIFPVFGDVPLPDVTPAALEDFRAKLTRSESEGGKGLKMKTARDMIDGTFWALYRDARTVDRLVSDDPFKALRWPAKVDPDPDPFTEAERDTLVAYFQRKDRHYYPLVVTMFRTGIRVGEAVGLRWGDLDLRNGTLAVRRSRTMREDNAPKTKRSRRTISLLPEVISALRQIPTSLHRAAETFVFTTQAGTPLDEERFVEKHWHRALLATSTRPRRFYACRHTFIHLRGRQHARDKPQMGRRLLRHVRRDDRAPLRALPAPRRGPARAARRDVSARPHATSGNTPRPRPPPATRNLSRNLFATAEKRRRSKAEGGRFELL
jgi:integrase